MSTETNALLTDRVLASAAARFGLEGSLQDLGGNVNFVYESTVNSRSVILRLTHNSRRSVQELIAEAEFVNFLADNGVPVSRVLPSQDDRLAEEVENGFGVVLFEKAPGRLPDESDFTPSFFSRWGQLTGRMHALATSYAPQHRRQHWHEEKWVQFRQYIPASQTLVLQRAEELLDRVRRLPVDRDGYGLIHGDLHARNFVIDGKQLIAFDFDDSCYNWFANEIAVILYHAALTRFSKPPRSGQEETEYAERFLAHFMAGYREEHDIDASWWQAVPDFLKLRRLLLYVFYHQELDMNNLSEMMAERVEQTRRDIERDAPITGLRFF